MTEEEQKVLAAHLRKPEGMEGRKVADMMNVGNGPMNRHALAVLNIQDAEHVLEIGMANGFFVSQILRSGYTIQYTGIDYAPDMVAAAAERNHAWVAASRAAFTEANASRIPLADETVQAVLAVNTYYFWPKPEQEFSEIFRVLTPGGRLVLAIRPRHILEKMPVTRFGFSLSNTEEIVAEIRAVGFSNIRETHIQEPHDFFNGFAVEKECVIIEAIK